MNYLDGLLILIIIFALWFGYARGLISLIAGLAGKLLLLILALTLAKPLAQWVGTRFGISHWLSGKLIDFFPRGKAIAEADMGRITAQKLPHVLDKMGLPPLLKFKIMEQGPELMAGGSASVTAIIQEMANMTAAWILQGLAFVVLFFFGGFFIGFLVLLVDRVLAGTMLGSFNRLLGMLVSFSFGLSLLIFFIGLTAPLLLAPSGGEANFLIPAIKGSYLYPRLLEAYGLLMGALISFA